MRLSQEWHIDTNSSFVQHSDPTHNDKTHYIQLWHNLYGA